MNKSDPLGLAPGEPFDAPEDAARDVHNFINSTSIRKNAEYGSIIYQVGDHFFASKPFSDGAGTRVVVGAPTDQSRVPEGKRVGDYHSHGDYSIPGPKDPKTGQPIPQRVTGPNAKRDDAMRGYNSDHPSTTSDSREQGMLKGRIRTIDCSSERQVRNLRNTMAKGTGNYDKMVAYSVNCLVLPAGR